MKDALGEVSPGSMERVVRCRNRCVAEYGLCVAMDCILGILGISCCETYGLGSYNKPRFQFLLRGEER
jgi:hypothetical protein